MKKMTVKNKAAKKISHGYPLILADDLATEIVEDEFVQLFDMQKNFLGVAYLSKQNKGAGWLMTQDNRVIEQDFYEEKFTEAFALRKMFFNDEMTTAFRIFNGEGDDLGGISMDYYAGYVVISWYNQFIYRQKQVIIRALKSVMPELLGVYEKLRFESDEPESAFVYGQEAPEPLIIKENGVNYATYLNEGLMTGVFLDQKNVRGELVNSLAAGKTLLNMFSYTGAFSVAAAAGGASETTSVDLAKRSLDKTREQFLTNGISPESQKIYVMDVFKYFSYARRKFLTYDIVVLDPPSFARNGKKTFSVAKNYGELVADAVDILSKNGILIASTNAANLTDEKFTQMVEEALEKKGVKYYFFQKEKLPADYHISREFSEGNYLKVLFIQIKK